MNTLVKFSTTNLIHDGAARGDIDAVSRQVKCGVDVNARQSGWCPLHMACQNGHTSIVAMLLKNGAQVNATGQNGWTALHLCSHKGFVQSAQMLLLFSANINAVDKDGCTPLHLSAIFGHTRVTEVLLQRGANINAQNNDGWTPLHYASRHGQLETVSLLLSYGAVELPDPEGRTPRDVAFGTEVQRLFQSKTDAQVDEVLVAVRQELASKEAEVVELRQELAMTCQRLERLETAIAAVAGRRPLPPPSQQQQQTPTQLPSSTSMTNTITPPPPRPTTTSTTHTTPTVAFVDEDEDNYVFAPRSMGSNEIGKLELGGDVLHGMEVTPRSDNLEPTRLSRDASHTSIPEAFIHPRRVVNHPNKFPNTLMNETSFS
eukprot:c6980_g1_i1.p1 GENE.c6980_g1_i1~~c6980_g1_i1.p1  ORF type:complete len:381 (-),score=79.91 c6980_g1_i1:18-1139(-)